MSITYLTTFLHLTNQLLRRLNEVEIAEAAFNTVLGVQALAKDSVQNSIRQINQAEFEWPFNATNADQVFTIGQEEYTLSLIHISEPTRPY